MGYAGDMNVFTSLLGCYNSVLPTIYLGLPLGDKYKGIHKWDRIIDRFNAKLAGWKKPYLTRAGKIALINSVLSSLPVYFMSLFDMPKYVELKLERIMRNFLWNDNKGHRKLHLVKWDVIRRRKRNGGLGVKKLRVMNNALWSSGYGDLPMSLKPYGGKLLMKSMVLIVLIDFQNSQKVLMVFLCGEVLCRERIFSYKISDSKLTMARKLDFGKIRG